MEEYRWSNNNTSIKDELNLIREQAIETIVDRAQAELVDYRNYDKYELRTAVGVAYDNWCESVLHNDFGLSQRQSQVAISRNLRQGRDPEQIARTPWLIYEVTLDLLEKHASQIDTLERLRFNRLAFRLTSLMVALGHLQIANLKATLTTVGLE